MDSAKFYDLSTKLGELRTRVEKFQNLHAYRYAYLCNSSPQGRSCKYAQATHKHFEADKEHLVLQRELQAIRRLLQDLENYV